MRAARASGVSRAGTRAGPTRIRPTNRLYWPAARPIASAVFALQMMDAVRICDHVLFGRRNAEPLFFNAEYMFVL